MMVGGKLVSTAYSLSLHPHLHLKGRTKCWMAGLVGTPLTPLPSSLLSWVLQGAELSPL